MRLKTRQIKFYCTEERYNFLQSIKVRKSASTQSLMNEALN